MCPAKERSMTQTLKLIYQAAKVRLGFLIMACALAGIAVSPGDGLAPWRVLVLGLAVLGYSDAWFDFRSRMKGTSVGQ